jgi:hypothetical protein
MLNNVTINSLYYDAKKSNDSLTLKKQPRLNRIARNRAYLHYKWGPSVHPSEAARLDSQPPFSYKTPFESEGLFPLAYIPTKDNALLPSAQEYAIFKERYQWN